MRKMLFHLERSVPKVQLGRFRITMTASCQDSASIPKCEGAGQIIDYNGHKVQVMHNGLKVLVDQYYGTEQTEIISLLRGHHEPQAELAFYHILKTLPPKATMLELGAYWSYYSLWFKQDHSNQRRAVALEPIPKNLAVGRENARLNDLGIEFVSGSIGLVSSPCVKFKVNDRYYINVRQYSVPELLELKKIGTLDILHCDAQGVELDVILSCADLFRNQKIRFCVISTHHHNISHDPLTHQRCLAAVEALGGQIIVEHDVNESFSGDGLIVAQFGTSSALEKVQISYNRYSHALFRNPLYDFEESMYPINGLKSCFRNSFVKTLYTRLFSPRLKLLPEAKISDDSLKT